MKPSFYRRARRSRSTAHSEGSFFKKEGSESAFFDSPAPTPFFGASANIQRKCDGCEDEKKHGPQGTAPVGKEAAKKEQEMVEKKKEEDKKGEDKKLHRKESGADGGSTAATSLTGVGGAGGSGSRLPEGSNRFFSDAIGYDFSRVKIHTGTDAAASAKAVNAKAYTIGANIVFGEGQYQPNTPEGKKLLAHELTHVAQQGERAAGLQRKEAGDEKKEEMPKGVPETIVSQGIGSKTENREDMGGCNNVNVHGRTRANYSNSWTATATSEPSTGCSGCRDAQCVTVSGTVDSVFKARPTVTLPRVPGGLSRCEQDAVRVFINTTLAAHEQEHVAAFNTYVGSESTSYTYTGCRSGLRAYQQSIHDGLEVQYRTAANAASAALDPFNATMPCDCE